MKNVFQNFSQTNKDRAASAFVGVAAITAQAAILMRTAITEELSPSTVPMMSVVAVFAFVAGKAMTEKFSMPAFGAGMFGAIAIGTAAAIVFIDEEKSTVTSSSNISYQSPVIS